MLLFQTKMQENFHWWGFILLTSRKSIRYVKEIQHNANVIDTQMTLTMLTLLTLIILDKIQWKRKRNKT